MGSCISKCKPKKKFKEDPTTLHVHDKLVISQDPRTISPVAPEITIIPSEKPLSPAPSTSSTASFSSFSCSTTNKCVTASSISSSSSLSSSSSYSSSVLMKDRSFSNDFLWSCAKENPHVVSLKENLDPSSLVSVARSPFSHSEREKAAPKKRARASSPTLVRQKSFRKEQSYCGGATPNRGLRSPSPSRRFNGESNRIFPNKESSYSYRNLVVTKGINAVRSAPKRESFRAPKREVSINGECLVRRNGGFSQPINSKIGDGKEIDVVMEDINNPLIALDCFIFL